MENSVIKQIVKVGNGSGVVLPKSWYGGKARVELIEKPSDIQKDVFEILKDYLGSVIGIYLAGSYARGEEDFESDIDIFVITSDINKKIVHGKYEILLVSEEKLKDYMESNVLPLLPMIKESKIILNKILIEKYKKTPLNHDNLKWYIKTTKSALNVNESLIKNYSEKDKNCGDEVSYSLVLRLRGVYLVDCMIKNKMWKNKDFLNLIKKISGSLNAYDGYLRVKKDLNKKSELPVNEAEKLKDYINEKIGEQEKWLKRKK
jgi:predicted nucleotidyltransferase